MSGGKTRSPAIAAAIIFFGFTLLFLVMPSIVLWLAQFSPWLAAGFGVLAVLSFFLIFWLRARHQRRSNR